LITFSIRAASLAVRTGSAEFIRDGLAALILWDSATVSEDYEDFRDYYIRKDGAFAVLGDAARRIRADYYNLLLEATQLGTSEARQNALTRNVKPSPIEAMRYTLYEEETGVSYVHIGMADILKKRNRP
jgi:hypothetical protein